MDSSDEDTFEENSNDDGSEEEVSEEEEIDEIFEDDQSSMSMDNDQDLTDDLGGGGGEVLNEPEMNWPPVNIPMSGSSPADKATKKKPGIIYLSSIPPGFNVSTSIAFFSQFGKVGRVFLQPGTKNSSPRLVPK